MQTTIVVLDDESSTAFNVAQAVASLGWVPVVQALSPATVTNGTVTNGKVSGLKHVILTAGRAPAAAQGLINAFVQAHLSRLPLVGIGNGALALAVALGLKLTDERPLGLGIVEVCHDGCLSFGNLAYRFRAWTPRLPRLVAQDLPEGLDVTATTPTGALLAFRHQTHPCEGVFFHPESSGTPDGLRWFANVFGVRG